MENQRSVPRTYQADHGRYRLVHRIGDVRSRHFSLPLSKIVLYSSGVGYFQHDGTVRDRAQVDLRFNVNQVNDLLKSPGHPGFRRRKGGIGLLRFA